MEDYKNEELDMFIKRVYEAFNVIQDGEVQKLCNECEEALRALAFQKDYLYSRIDTSKVGIKSDDLFHLAGIIKVDDTWYIVDPTYGQFYLDISFKEYMSKHHPELNSLLTKGYIPYSIDILRSYFDGFASVYGEEIDFEKVNEIIGKAQ